MKLVSVAVLALAFVAVEARGAPRSDVPLPRPRPTDLHAPRSPPPEEDKNEAAEKPAGDEACLERLKSAGFTFEPATQHAAANPACVIDTPVKLMAVPVATRGASVRMPEEPMLACRFAERLGHFLGDLAAPLIAGRLAVEVKAVRTGPGYECRNRNRAANGHLSAHALGIAVDVAAFELANGKALPIKPDGDARGEAAVAAVRTAACGWFTTILGPGSDPAHTDHMHLDILIHGSSDRYRICQ
ncbi:MAG: extensin family protein [Hyphomicrobiales bacterium]|nr:extensin family protein [Hyphomicrobiales bacterium]MBV8825470.1 extensin family protein [Hyphomicrobiales bacterium]MBV9429480.1 extensin family protein [Bradyrhizobiaceae bacterium]